MAVYIIEGSTPLHGNIRVHGAKNAALPVLAAALLPPESEIEGCPRLSDTAAAMNILRSLGCRVEQQPDGTAQVDSRSAQGWEIPESCMREMRSSIIFLGAILTRYGRARVSFPGGCELGPRPIDLHLAALERMGAVIREDHGALDCTVPMGRLHGAEIVLSFPSVGATQNVLIAAVLAEGRTILRGAAQEPEIDDLIRFLNGAGARIRQDFAGTLIVDGVDSLHAVRHRVIPDRIAAATYLCCAAAAGGSITVEGKPTGRGYQICVSDTGDGIAKEHLGQLFSPYYTTKTNGHHIGLGLYYCRNVMRKHGGSIQARQNETRGTTFVLRFPGE